jgi:hypothetical protein
MIEKAPRKFRPLIGLHEGEVGELVGSVDYLGCPLGWHPLQFCDGSRGRYAGDELSEVRG